MGVNGNLNTQLTKHKHKLFIRNKQIPIRITAMFEGEDETKDYILKIKEVEEPDY